MTGNRPLPPGPRGHPVFGVIDGLRRDPLGTFLGARAGYGDVVRLRYGGPFAGTLVARPDGVKHVLQDHHRNYTKVPWYNTKLAALIGQGLLTSGGDHWLRQRRLMQPAFHRQTVEALGGAMAAAAEEAAARWAGPAARGEAVDVAAEMMQLTLTVVGRTLLGAEVSADTPAVAAAVAVSLHHIERRMESYLPPPEWLPTPGNRRFRAARRALDRIVYRVIAERRAEEARGERRGDLLSLLLAARDEETGRGMDGRQLRDEVMTIVLAGHETTANALTWTWYLLDRHPAAAERLRAELAAVLGGRTPTVADLPNLPYTRRVLDEALRLYPPAWALSRWPLADDEVGGHRIPRRSIVFLIPYVTHRHPDFWENPEAFDPDRFAPERSAGRPRYAYFPFGGGPRLCIGDGFALMEAQLVLATLAQRFRPALVPGYPVELDPSITLRPRHGLRMTLHPVAPGDGAPPAGSTADPTAG